MKSGFTSASHWTLRCWLLAVETLRAKCAEAVESLRAESRELLLMVGKSINTASARMQGKTIGA